VYDEIEAHLKEHAEQIAGGASDIKAQRLQFVTLSDKTYELVKAFGAGQPVYHIHCPMARDKPGAMWVSQSKEVRNPYFGAKMPNCGTVEEEIK
jgi:hypothetical protein